MLKKVLCAGMPPNIFCLIILNSGGARWTEKINNTTEKNYKQEEDIEFRVGNSQFYEGCPGKTSLRKLNLSNVRKKVKE